MHKQHKRKDGEQVVGVGEGKKRGRCLCSKARERLCTNGQRQLVSSAGLFALFALCGCTMPDLDLLVWHCAFERNVLGLKVLQLSDDDLPIQIVDKEEAKVVRQIRVKIQHGADLRPVGWHGVHMVWYASE